MVGGQVLDQPASGRFVPAERRRVGVVFQDHLLFAHLSVVENVAFGLRARGVDRGAALARALEWLERVGLRDAGHLRPWALSGGQAQRVALARALVTDPAMLLLDEPMAALDASTRPEVRAHLATFGGPTVLVTHDPVDAMVLADQVAVLEHGRLVQQGTPHELATAPRTTYVARLMGMNLYRARSDGTNLVLEGGGTLRVPGCAQGAVCVALRPAAVSLHRSRPDGSPRNVWRGAVVGLERHADAVRVRVEGAPAVLADVTAEAVAELRLAPGDVVWVAVKATDIRTYARWWDEPGPACGVGRTGTAEVPAQIAGDARRP